MSSYRDRVLLQTFLLLLAGTAFARADEVDLQGLPMIGSKAVVTQEKFSFAILGDKTSGGDGEWGIFDQAVDAMNLLAPDFVISVGDQIPGHMEDRATWDAQWSEFRAHAERLTMPLILIPGNHDIANLACEGFWKEDFGPTYFSFDHGGVHFLVLNTEEERMDGRGPVWQAMMEFAERDLEQHVDAQHTFVFFHKPMWDDPRYEADWARLNAALGDRPRTVVAGHEHYLMSEWRDGHRHIVFNATGGGVRESAVRAFGGFHAFGHVTVDGDEVHLAIIEPGGGIWPPEVAPASFRKAIAHEVITFDAAMPEGVDGETVRVRPILRFHNPFDEAIVVEARVTALDFSGWAPAQSEGGVLVTETLRPGEKREHTLDFTVPRGRLPYPPGVAWRVQYGGAWLDHESYPMVQETCMPLYPAETWRVVPAWQVAGPFALGPIDATHLPANPKAANAKFFHRFGPEDGFDGARSYEGGRRWILAENQGRGLINFNGILGTQDHALAYALCGIHSPEAQKVHALVYSDNYAQAVLNGELIVGAQDFGTSSGYLYVPLALEAGWNTFIVKLMNNRGDWFLRTLIADPRGNLEFAAVPGVIDVVQ
jgi:hypothetical protein